MLETDAHKAFRKKLESLTTKYEPQFPFAKFVSCVTYWNCPTGTIRPYIHESFGIYQPVVEFNATQIQVASNPTNENFNRACTEVFARAYFSHKMRSEGMVGAMNIQIEGRITHNPYWEPAVRGLKLEFILPDVEQSWIKYFEELQPKLDVVYNELKERGGIVAIETNA